MLRDANPLHVIHDEDILWVLLITGFRTVDVINFSISLSDSNHASIVIEIDSNGLIRQNVAQSVF